MTILHLISSGGFYGAESMLLALAEAQLQAGMRPVIAVFEHQREPHVEMFERAAAAGIEAHLVPCKGRWDRAAVASIRTLAGAAKVLHCHGYKADMYGFAAAWPHRVRLVSTCHNWPDRRLSMRAYAAMDRFVLRCFDQVTTPSKYVARKLQDSGVRARRVTIIENGIDVARFQNAEPTLKRALPHYKTLVGVVGRLTAEKGGTVLLKAAPAVLRRFPRTGFVFAGDGPSRTEWESMASDLGIREQVFFAGTRTDMPNVYASLDILVLPSFEEAMPMSVLEGMAASRPVIATRVGEIPKLIDQGVTGVLIEPGDPGALSAAIVSLLRDPGTADLLGHNGQALVARSFSSDAMARKYSSVYEAALRRRPGLVRITAPKADAI